MTFDRSAAPPAVGARSAAGTTRRVRVLIVDDQPVFRRVARSLIAATDGFEEVGEAASGREALRLVGEAEPDLVLLDVRMPGMDGIETAKRLCVLDPRLVVILVSLEPLADLPSATLCVGAAAHICKQDLTPAALHELWRVHGAAGQPS